ncbi:hypothetical protein PC110_g19713 [Phytophthora cactorum]|uniref:Uncharacterized protein n=1 Tax=Phytophthora cactorum TaxID=29920 RepID=A0A329RKW4_9STRA|nr:hypothetical protein PC110_g19713 [Phytophthora cactorum]
MGWEPRQRLTRHSSPPLPFHVTNVLFEPQESIEDLPPISFVERLSIGGEETAISGVNSPIVDIVAKRIETGELQYLVLTATYETFWLSRAALTPGFGTLIRTFKDADHKKLGLPELRRNIRLVEVNAGVDGHVV